MIKNLVIKKSVIRSYLEIAKKKNEFKFKKLRKISTSNCVLRSGLRNQGVSIK